MKHALTSRIDSGLIKKIFAFIVILFIIDVILVSYWLVHLGDLLFIEGGFIFAAGAFVATGAANQIRESPRTLFADPEGYARFLREQRKKQYADGGLMMVVGAIIITISIVVSQF
jgi:hypothetical protein